MLARWSIDGLVHAVSVNDTAARGRLAAQMSVKGYAAVLEGRTESTILAAYDRRLWFNVGVLLMFNVLLLTLTMWALKKKDIL